MRRYEMSACCFQRTMPPTHPHIPLPLPPLTLVFDLLYANVLCINGKGEYTARPPAYQQLGGAPLCTLVGRGTGRREPLHAPKNTPRRRR